MSRYRTSSPVPVVAGVVLLAAFAGLVIWATRADDTPEDAPFAPPVGQTEPEPESAAPEPEPEPEPEPPPRMSAEAAERLLRAATAKWRAFAVELCEAQGWPEEKAVAFLKTTTWNDRDKEKQHAHGLQSLARMTGVAADDPVALAEALARARGLEDFFAGNWQKLDVEWEPEPEVEVLEDAWKETRLRWGFPLDTPIDDLQDFQRGRLDAALRVWQGLAVAALQQQGTDQAHAGERIRALLGTDPRTRAIKMRAAFRVLFEMPDASVKQVVDELVRRLESQKQEEFAQSVAGKLADAVQAAESAE